MTKHVALYAFLSCMAATAVQADLCRDIRSFDGQDNEITLVSPTAGVAQRCKQSILLSGGRQMHCSWVFEYRALAAMQAFEQLIKQVADCFGSAAQVTEDLDVNHPDFYDLQTFRFEGQEIGVSLKDKAALSETYVFLRITLPN